MYANLFLQNLSKANKDCYFRSNAERGLDMGFFFNRDVFKKLGYIQDQRGILRRYRREKSAWHNHLEHTKAYIKKQCFGKHFRSMAVLGSGYLLDLPIDELLNCCDHIYLYDVNHPSKIRSKFKDNSKINFVRKDITGLTDFVHSVLNSDNVTDIFERPIPEWNIDNHDGIISLNILNQLDIILLDYIRERIHCTKELEDKLREKIQSDHIASFGDIYSILVADTQEVRTDTATNQSTIKSNLYTELDKHGSTFDQESWDWFFDNSGRYIENSTVKFRVNAVTYNKTSQPKCAEL